MLNWNDASENDAAAACPFEIMERVSESSFASGHPFTMNSYLVASDGSLLNILVIDSVAPRSLSILSSL